ncbi:hypothetical protein Q6304_28745, partial [Klebsiella pneumoniae]|nr:hypothetical protein [Klebsiella pneumoniae]
RFRDTPGHPQIVVRAVGSHHVFAADPGAALTNTAMGSFSAPIEIRGLTKTFKAAHAVNDLSFDVQAGSITGFLGPNG